MNDVGEKISFNFLLVAVCVLVTSAFVAVKLVKPALRTYTISKTLEKVATNPKIHWFYGHIKFVSLLFFLKEINNLLLF